MKAQILYLILTVFGLGITLAKHGEPRDPYNFWGTLLSTAMLLGILYWGGFFDCFFK